MCLLKYGFILGPRQDVIVARLMDGMRLHRQPKMVARLYTVQPYVNCRFQFTCSSYIVGAIRYTLINRGSKNFLQNQKKELIQTYIYITRIYSCKKKCLQHITLIYSNKEKCLQQVNKQIV